MKLKLKMKGVDDWEIKGTDEQIEKKLIDWFLECGDLDKTIRMVENELDVNITKVY